MCSLVCGVVVVVYTVVNCVCLGVFVRSVVCLFGCSVVGFGYIVGVVVFMCLCVYSFGCLCICVCVCVFACLFVCLSVCLFVYCFVWWFGCLFVCLCVCLFVCLVGW